MSNPLFHFRFSGELDSRRADVLREASGMRISLANTFDREPGQGSIGDTVSLWLSQGDKPDTWEIQAWANRPEDYDANEVERRRLSIRRALPQIAEKWEEIGP
jgi:hypothetical protein